MDESGHDHKNTPMEVRGGVAIHASKLWDFVQDWDKRKEEVFGKNHAEWGVGELKGHKLLEKPRVNRAAKLPPLNGINRRKGVQRYLTRSKQGEKVVESDIIAYSQACVMMVDEVFDILKKHEAVIFASLIPCGVKPLKDFKFSDYLRKDYVFLQERFFNFLEQKTEHGLFVMDRTENTQDKRFVKRLYDYYTKTENGQKRTKWVIPSPLFLDSEMSPGIQAADICIYCINWGFRISTWDFTGKNREDIASRFGAKINNLQFQGEVYNDGKAHPTRGIVYVPDPYTSRG